MNLSGNQQVLEKLFASSAEGILVVDVKGIIVLANPRCEELFGYPVSELVGKKVEALVPEGAKQDHARLRKGFFEHPEVRPMANGVRLYGLHKKGEEFPIAVSLSYFHLQNNAFAVAHIADMTARRQIEDERDMLFSVFHQTLNEIYIIDASSFQIKMANNSALSNTGYTFPELQQLAPWHIKQGHTKESFRQLVEPLFQGNQEKIVFEAEFRRKNSSSYLTRAYLQKAEYNNMQILVEVVTDITKQQQTIEALRISEVSLQKEKERAQLYLDIAASIFVVINRDQTIAMINQKGCEVLETDEKGAVGKNWFDHYLPKEEKEEVRKVFRDILQGKLEGVEVYENYVRTQTGKKRLIEWHNRLLKNEKGVFIGTLSSGIDITEKRAAEKAVMQALIEGQEVERQRIARELHDGLGQSLTAIRLNLNTLEADLDKFNQHSKEGFEQVKNILNNATQDVKTISRNLMPTVLQDYGLEKALEYLCQTLNDTLQVKVFLQIHRIPSLLTFPVTIGLYRIVQELLNNILKYAQATEINIQLIGHDTSVVLMVEDDGIGFELEKVKKGLGLKNIETRVKAMDGTLLIDTQHGHGTSVTVEIPKHSS